MDRPHPGNQRWPLQRCAPPATAQHRLWLLPATAHRQAHPGRERSGVPDEVDPGPLSGLHEFDQPRRCRTPLRMTVGLPNTSRACKIRCRQESGYGRFLFADDAGMPSLTPSIPARFTPVVRGGLWWASPKRIGNRRAQKLLVLLVENSWVPVGSHCTILLAGTVLRGPFVTIPHARPHETPPQTSVY
jgi:hypothetical protein